MPKNQRLVLLTLAALVAVLAVVLLGSGDDDPEPSTPSAVVETATPEATPAPSDNRDTDPEQTATPKPRPPVPTLSADNPRRLKVQQGDTVRFAVTSAQDDEIHVHGYDKSKDVRGGKKTEMRFKADITGIFEIELEQSGSPIGELEVRP